MHGGRLRDDRSLCDACGDPAALEIERGSRITHLTAVGLHHEARPAPSEDHATNSVRSGRIWGVGSRSGSPVSVRCRACRSLASIVHGSVRPDHNDRNVALPRQGYDVSRAPIALAVWPSQAAQSSSASSSIYVLAATCDSGVDSKRVAGLAAQLVIPGAEFRRERFAVMLGSTTACPRFLRNRTRAGLPCPKTGPEPEGTPYARS